MYDDSLGDYDSESSSSSLSSSFRSRKPNITMDSEYDADDEDDNYDEIDQISLSKATRSWLRRWWFRI